MQRITLALETVTPCFLGSSDRQAVAEWRAASVRGQLRWWLRAAASPDQGLGEVRQAEERIFGSTERSSLLRVQTLGAPRRSLSPEEAELLRPGDPVEIAIDYRLKKVGRR